MDDFSISSLSESKNEWCARLVNIFTPAVISGLKSIFKEAWTLCKDNDEEDKYLMTFQTFLSRVPKWNKDIIETERKRISEVSGCGYLEELITCVHIIQLKALSCVRVGQKQKKIDIDIPSVDDFVHKIYINVARKLYTNVYLFEKNIPPLQIQKHNRELEMIIKECIMNTIRDSIPVETILRAYMEETIEQDVEVKEEEIIKEVSVENNDDSAKIDNISNDETVMTEESSTVVIPKEDVIINENNKVLREPINENIENTNIENENIENENIENKNISIVVKRPETTYERMNIPDRIGFSDIDDAISITGEKSIIEAPKTIDRLERIATETSERRKAEAIDDEDDEDDDKLVIGDSVNLEISDINDLNRSISLNPPILDDIEIIS